MKDYISRIEKGDIKAFDRLYSEYKSQFLALFRKCFDVGREEGLDLYQDVCAILYSNITSGRLTSDSMTKASLKTYVNQIGKYVLFNKRRKRQVPLLFDTDMLLTTNVPEEEYDKEKDDLLFIVKTAVRDMPPTCSKLLYLSLFERKHGDEIVRIMGKYSNADSVKSQVYKCKSKLKETIIKRLRKYGYEYDG